MNTKKKPARTPPLIATAVGLAALSFGGEAGRVVADDSLMALRQEKGAVTMEGKFYCNIQALQPAERERHMQLTEKLIRVRRDVVESENGYEFQYSPADISLAELVEWVVAEGRCCPFFDFHIDLEREGTFVCLRLTGEEGIKAFIRAEFPVAGK